MHTTEAAEQHYSAALEQGIEHGQVVTSNVPFVVTHVAPRPGYQLAVRFIDGTAGQVQMREMIFDPAAGVFAALRDPAVFAKVAVDEGVVTWPNGLDLAPDAMYDEIQQNGVWVLR